MQFLQIVQAPVVRAIPAIGDKPARQLLLPRFTIDEFIEWGAEIEAANVERATDNMNEMQRREYLTLYPPTSPDINELRRLVITPIGARRIVQSSLMRAKVRELREDKSLGLDLAPLEEAEIEAVLKALGTYGTTILARELADLDDRSLITPKPPTGKTDTTKAPDGADPLPGSASPGSKTSSTTGQKK